MLLGTLRVSFMGLAGTILATVQIFNIRRAVTVSSSDGDLVVGVSGPSSPSTSLLLGMSQLDTFNEQRRFRRLGDRDGIEELSSQEEERRRRLSFREQPDRDLASLSQEEGGFAACLMLMDDNHFLVEWLAYHYHALPLKHLTVLVDPKSTTSPLGIFERWQDRIQIEVVDWTWPNAHEAPVPKYLANETAIRQYIGRQNLFYGDCMKQYKRRNWNSWILLTDTDEFLSVNRWVDEQSHPLFDGIIPSSNERGSVSKRLEQLKDRNDQCIMTDRTQTCSEKQQNAKIQKRKDAVFKSANLGDAMQSRDFLSFEYDTGHSLKNPKGMVHAGRIPLEYFERYDALHELTAHMVAPPGIDCPVRPYFRMYHHTGNDEQRRFRDAVDPRGPAANRKGGSRVLIPRQCRAQPTSHVEPWLVGFAQDVGTAEARRLLDGVGQTKIWPPYRSEAMKL